jgi:hypothetical protein
MNLELTQPKIFPLSVANRWLKALIYGLASLTIVYLLFWISPAILKRVFFMGELEHQEGLTAHTIWFLQRGGNIYQKPDIHFAGSIYGPLYFYAASLFTQLTQLSLQSLRIFSMICIFGTAICVFLLMRFYGLNRFLSGLWLPIYFVYWPIHGWIDIARLEAFFMFTLFVGLGLFNTAKNRSYRYFLAGAVIGLSISTKQTGALFLLLAIPEFYKNRTFYFLSGALVILLFVEGFSFIKFGNEIEEVFQKILSIQPTIMTSPYGEIDGIGLDAKNERETTELVLQVIEVADRNGLKLPREFGILLKQVSYTLSCCYSLWF